MFQRLEFPVPAEGKALFPDGVSLRLSLGERQLGNTILVEEENQLRKRAIYKLGLDLTQLYGHFLLVETLRRDAVACFFEAGSAGRLSPHGDQV